MSKKGVPKKRMKFFNKVLSILMVFMMMISVMPNLRVSAATGVPVINTIKLTKFVNHKDNTQQYILYINGTNLKDRYVQMVSDTGKVFKLGTLVSDGSNSFALDNTMKSVSGGFTLNPESKNTIEIEGYSGPDIEVGLNSLPSVTSATPSRVYTTDGLTVSGSGFDKLKVGTAVYDSSMYMKFSSMTVPYDYKDNNTISITDLSKTSLSQPGNYDIEVGKTETVGTITVNQQIEYENEFKIIQDLTGIKVDGFSVNKGVSGTTAATSSIFKILGSGMNANMSVFFMKKNDGTEDYDLKLKSPNVTVAQDTYNKVLGLNVTVPANINAGDYFVVITNKVSNTEDPNLAVNSEYIINSPKFTVITDSAAMKVYSVRPGTGTDAGLDAAIDGRYLGILNNDDIDKWDTEKNVSIPSYDIQPNDVQISNDKKSLIFIYNGVRYKGVGGYTVTKTMKITVGDIATFTDKSKNPSLSPSFDTIDFHISPITVSKEEYRDVTVDTTTSIFSGSTDILDITETAVKTDGFAFEPSIVEPIITNVAPSTAAKDSDVYISIKGSNFLVYKYVDSTGAQKTKYPKVMIGSSIVLDKNTDPTNVDITVLDAKNNVLDGSKTLMYGSMIIIKVPASVAKPDGKQNVSVQNPIINNDDGANGKTDTLSDAFEFKVPQDSEKPSITTVDPSMVSTDGNVDITVTGNNFKPDCIVTIDGQVMSGITVDGKGETIKFKAPAYRAVKTLLQVINPTGGIASHEFTYTKTYTNPKLTSVVPEKGKANTVVTITGNNFIRPDTTATEDQIERLIGTTVLFDGKDLNDYYKVNDVVKLQSFNGYGNVFSVDSTGKVVINGSDAYRDGYASALFKDTSSGSTAFFSLYKTLDGNVMMQDNQGFKYTVIAAKNSNGDTIFKMRDKDSNETLITMPAAGELSFGPNANSNPTYQAVTPYSVTDNVITGKHVFVRDDDTIEVVVPSMVSGAAMIEGSKNVTVKNPDTKSVTVQNGFYYYAQPKSKPSISTINPAQGTEEGGNVIKITGSGFYDGARVFFGSQEADSKKVSVTEENGEKVIYVTVPKYPGDLLKDKGVSKLSVPVVILNPDGGSASLVDGYQYLVPVSHPKISQISPTSDTAAGGSTVTILGSDFRDYEPFTDNNGNGVRDSGEPYIDLNNNNQYDSKTVKVSGTYDDANRALLPRIFFGGNQAKVIDFSTVKTYNNGSYTIVDKIDCILPKYYSQGKVDVSIMNSDGGTAVSKGGFEYKQSSPKISSIVPDKGPKAGGTTITVNGSGFVKNNIRAVFGNVTNADLPISDANSGNIIAGKATVALGNITAHYFIDSSNNDKDTVYLSGLINGVTYTGKNYVIPDEGYIYLNLGSNTTQSNDGNTDYAGLGMPGYDNENVKLQIQDGRLMVIRKYAYSVVWSSDNLVSVVTPPMETIGKYDMTIINEDNGSAVKTFEYTNPGSNPKIYNILKGGESAKTELLNGNAIAVHDVSSKGGTQLKITGTDFRDGIKVMIGAKEAKILSDPITSSELMISLPAGADVIGKLLKVVVQNEDGASASSTDLQPPVYIRYDLAESSPTVTSVTPSKGTVKGGTSVTIKGNNFKDGLKVYFGINLATNIKVVDYKTITCIVPVNAVNGSPIAGDVDVIVENPDSGQGILENGYTYISSPEIKTVSQKTISVEGGDVVTVSGSGFMTGATAYVGSTVELLNTKNPQKGTVIYIGDTQYVLTGGVSTTDIEFVDSGTIKVTFPEGNIDLSGLIIVNSDSGATGKLDDFKYVLNKPQAPTGVTAVLTLNKYIRVSWSEVNNVDYYKVYKIINGQYYFVDIVKTISYIEDNLTGDTSYKFAVRAVKNDVDSDYSSESNVVITPSNVQSSDSDGAITDNLSIDLSSGGSITVNIGRKNFTSQIDLTDYKYRNAKDISINIPAYWINKSSSNVTLIVNGGSIIIPVKAFAVREIQNLSDEELDYAVGRLKVNLEKDDLLLSQVPSKNIIVSDMYNIEAEVQVNSKIIQLEQLADEISMTISYDSNSSNKVKNYKYKAKAYSYDYDNLKWQVISSKDSGDAENITTNQTGTFVVMLQKI